MGFGGNGEVTYIDSVMAPFPAIRYLNLIFKEQGIKRLIRFETNSLKLLHTFKVQRGQGGDCNIALERAGIVSLKINTLVIKGLDFVFFYLRKPFREILKKKL